ncbi:LuxR family transcriptional regulator [Amycolatopsis suaedae]|uniref:LuxR family transcriptional regulator n=1 Tax=Amycolatopsis suaedae TaxID=2510978 RepID=A0A4Q7JEQ2_9PSEU|nr:LuxR family transcriptional regulator [Amycolatopsis suaedae]
MLVGREAELHTLVSAVTAAPAVILLEGEAGVGKTRLVTEMLRSQELAGRAVLVGQCQQLREPFPYGVLLDALRTAGDHLSPGTLGPETGALRPYLPEVTALPPAPEPLGDPRAERHRLFRAIRALLRALDGALLVVEDVHWADDGSRELLRLLMADPPPSLAVLITYRGEERPGGLPLGGAFRPAPGVASALIHLDPLGTDEVRRLACVLLGEQPVSLEFAVKLHERTAGIPFVVEETLRTVHTADDELLDELEVPVLLREAMAQRLAGLPLPARRLADAAAVLGVPADVELLAEVAALLPERAVPALARLADGAVLLEQDGGRYDFRHTLARQAVYRSVAGPDRRALHLRCVRVLSRREPKPLLALAEHSRLAGAVTEWVHYGEAAADRAAEVGDPATATRLLRRLLDEPALARHDVDRLAVKFSQGASNGLAQHEVAAALERLLSDHRLSESCRGEVRLGLGMLLIRQYGGIAAGRMEIAQACDELAERPALALKAKSVLALPFVGSASVAEHLRWMAEVDTEVAASTDRLVRTTMLASTTGSRLHLGDPVAWAQIDQLPATVGSPAEQRQLARAHCNLADACAWTGHFDRAQGFLRSGIQLAADCGAPFVVGTARATQAHLDWLTGEWTGLEERCTRLLDEYRDLVPVAGELSLVLGSLAVARGEWDSATARFAEAGVGDPDNAIAPVALAAFGGTVRMLLARDQIAEAIGAADRGLALLRQKNVWSWAGELVPPAVDAYCRAGRQRAAAEALDQLHRALTDRDAPHARAALAEAAGILAQHQSSPAAAVERLDDARRRYERLPAPYPAALVTERLLGLRPDDPERYAALAEEFERLGAARDGARCRHVLRVGGAVTPSRRGRRGYGNELSPRERDVARLVAAGRTNREIAEVLFLSRRTVEQHVAGVLRKLGARSRAELHENPPDA